MAKLAYIDLALLSVEYRFLTVEAGGQSIGCKRGGN